MFEGKTILALIPARGGSKGVPKKNIKSLCGHPLIAYTISAARKSKYVDAVVVTTDSEEIAETARRYGADVPFLRPAELADDASRSIDAACHAVAALKEMGRQYDVLVWLQPTSPLRRVEDIDQAIERYFSHGELGLVSVCSVSENPVLIRKMDTSGVLHPLLMMSSTVRRQDMPLFYHVDGAIYINKVSEISPETSLNDNPIGFLMPKDHSVDIDSIDDFINAERILANLDMPLIPECAPADAH